MPDFHVQNQPHQHANSKFGTSDFVQAVLKITTATIKGKCSKIQIELPRGPEQKL